MGWREIRNADGGIQYKNITSIYKHKQKTSYSEKSQLKVQTQRWDHMRELRLTELVKWQLEKCNEADMRRNEGATYVAVPVSKDRCSKQLIKTLCNASASLSPTLEAIFVFPCTHARAHACMEYVWLLQWYCGYGDPLLDACMFYVVTFCMK